MESEQFSKIQKSTFFRFFDRLAYLVEINFLMLFFILCGLVLFGLYPAVFAANAMFNDILERKEGRTVSKFWRYYKRYFKAGNFLMAVNILSLGIGYWLIFKLNTNISIFFSTTLYFFFFVCMLFVISWNFYLPAVLFFYKEFSVKKKLIFCIVVTFTKWKLTLKLFSLSIIWIITSALFPQLMLFVYFSVLPWFSIWIIKWTLKPETLEKMEE